VTDRLDSGAFNDAELAAGMIRRRRQGTPAA
jgi:hypothetical protein